MLNRLLKSIIFITIRDNITFSVKTDYIIYRVSCLEQEDYAKDAKDLLFNSILDRLSHDTGAWDNNYEDM